MIKAYALKDLGALKAALEQSQRDRARREAAAAAARQKAQREHELFARSVGKVVRLRDPGRVAPSRPLPPPEPLQRERDEAQALREALSDEFDVESLLDTDEALSFRRPDVPAEVVRRLRRGHWTIQAELDLHGLRRDEAREQLSAFLREAAQHQLRCLRVVHGKGHGSPGKAPVLKAKVRAWLVQKSEVAAFAQARPVDGGAGALIVLLRSA